MTRSWVALYTLGLPRELRVARRLEIDSDLWEQQWLASRRGDPAFGTAIEVLTRMLLGIISDISWRTQAGASARPDWSKRMNNALSIRVALPIGVTMVLLAVLAAGGLGWYWMLGVAAVPIAAIAILGFRNRRTSSTNVSHRDLNETPSEGRWKRHLLVVVVSIAAVVGIWCYAVTLETWGGTLPIVLSVVGLVAMTIGFTAVVMLVSDFVGNHSAHSGQGG
jgi:hypothetical protein